MKLHCLCIIVFLVLPLHNNAIFIRMPRPTRHVTRYHYWHRPKTQYPSSFSQWRPLQPRPVFTAFSPHSVTSSRGVSSAAWSQVVPAKLSSVPGQVVRVQWPRFSPAPGDTMLTGQMRDRPQLTWSGDSPGDLFTIMIVDEGIERLNGQQYAHWLVTNVPGSGNALDGSEMMRYVEPFLTSADDPKHPMLILVYKQQSGRVQFEEYQRGCSPSIVSSRYKMFS